MQIPPYENWLSSSALSFLASYVVAAIVGVIGIRAAASPKWTWAVIAATVVVALFGWYNSARQEQLSEEKDRTIAGLRIELANISDDIKKIATRVGADLRPGRSQANIKEEMNSLHAQQLKSRELGRLTRLYIMSHDGISSEIMAGMELPPVDWLNEQLEKQDADWRVKAVHGAQAETYDINPSPF